MYLERNMKGLKKTIEERLTYAQTQLYVQTFV